MVLNQPIKLSKSLRSDCLNFCNSRGITIPNLLLGTLQILLHRYSDQKVIFIGLLNNQIPSNKKDQNSGSVQWIKSDSFSSISFENFIQHNSLNILNSKTKPSDPLETLLESLQPKTETSGSAYFKVFFNFSENKKTENQTMDSSNLASSFESMSNSYLNFDFYETNGVIEGLAQCNVDLWDSRAFERLVLHFVELLKAGIETHQKMILQLPLLTPKEFDQLTNL